MRLGFKALIGRIQHVAYKVVRCLAAGCVSPFGRNFRAFCAHVFGWFGGPRSVVAVSLAIADAIAARPSSTPIRLRLKTALG